MTGPGREKKIGIIKKTNLDGREEDTNQDENKNQADKGSADNLSMLLFDLS